MPVLPRSLCLALALLTCLGLSAAPGRAHSDAIGAGLADALRGLDALPPPSGVLYDRVLPLAGATRFDGSATAPRGSAATWRQLVDELRRASSDPRGLPERDAVERDLRTARRGGVIPIAVLDERFDRIRPDAVATGALVARAGAWQPGAGTPYLSARAFAAAALVERTWRGADVSFALDRAHWVGNAGMPRAVAIDFDDGRGFRIVAFGERVHVHYPAVGARTVRVRATSDDGVERTGAFGFDVAALTIPSPDDTLHVTGTVPYLGEVASGDAYVYLAANHTTLVNPVVVIEGFDLDNSMNWDELYALLDQQALAETLHVRGYDAVVLNFANATDYIERNGFLVATLLEQVQSMLPPGGSMAVVGASMGGLCSRFALDWLELQGTPHDVRTWISFDGPQSGAAIPLGLQYWVKWFSGQAAEAAFFLGVLDSPAAREMLIDHYTDPPSGAAQTDPLRTTLQQEFALIGDWPALSRRVAIVNGSGTGANQGFLPGDQLIQYSYSSFLVTVRGNVWAVPDQVSHVVFDGELRVLFSGATQTVTVTGGPPIDGAPGGSRASMAELDAVTAPYGDIVAVHPSHDFIPTVSSLALTTNDYFYDVAGDPALLDHTPFDAVYVPADNQPHVTITAQNAAWFLHELELGLVGVDPGTPGAPRLATLSAAPNPFRPGTRLTFTLPRAGNAALSVYGVDGRRVRSLLAGPLAAGRHDVEWDGTDAGGTAVAPGLYFVRLAAGDLVRTLRVARLR